MPCGAPEPSYSTTFPTLALPRAPRHLPSPSLSVSPPPPPSLTTTPLSASRLILRRRRCKKKAQHSGIRLFRSSTSEMKKVPPTLSAKKKKAEQVLASESKQGKTRRRGKGQEVGAAEDVVVKQHRNQTSSSYRFCKEEEGRASYSFKKQTTKNTRTRESHPDYLPWFSKVSHLRVSPCPVAVPYTESAEERNAAALAILDSVLGGTRATTSTCPYELRQALVEVQRTLRGPEAVEASRAGPSSAAAAGSRAGPISEAAEASRYTRRRRRDRT
ncbi:hypothetical protein RHMOL_Rhmol02G0198500 [Rhododendron molle]|uniref:Uncharacterized protein n=1 Tax=Rhododendron molle TaxID=49168 RepID=A0ACC0PTF9_RHOML|nr:hypothetical protein RHMOL_Rhmol02G0198500 [Rhododendron molle]